MNRASGTMDSNKKINICVIKVWERRKNRTEKILEEIVARNFTYLAKDTNL